MRNWLLILALTAFAPVVTAQAPVPGNCELGRAQRDIDIGDVEARIFNTGSLYFGNSSQAHYLVPRATGRTPLFAAGFWVGGYMEGELRVAGATYARFEFWPGPLDRATGRPPDPDDCSAHDRIWKLSRGDLERYYRTGEVTDDLAEWPHYLGAPVFDGDGDPTNYDLAAGDQPALSGDQTLWWVMNDVGNAHRFSRLPPIGLEVQVTAFGFGSGPAALNQATFYRLRVVNRSSDRLEDAYLGYWSDPDLGDGTDDWTGSDTLRQFAYVYNADNNDGNGTGGTYGPAPPATGVQFVQGPIALPNGRDDNRNGEIDEPNERNGMSSFMYFINGTAVPTVDPGNGIEMNHLMRGRWTDGTPLTEGGLGLNPGSNLVTTYAHPGDPVLNRFWSARCPDSPQSCGPSLTPGNWKFVVSTGPFELAPGEADEVLIAVIFGQGSDNFDSVSALRRASAVVRGAFETGLLDPRHVPGFVEPPGATIVEIRRPAPNPFEGSATLGITLPSAAHLRVALVDVLGREVALLLEGPREAGRHDVPIAGAPLAPGVYVSRIWVNGESVAALPMTRR